jgi:5-methylcytosine-specific restriction endonuclease McrA
VTRLREEWLRDDPGYPLGPGMPSGRTLRADGQSHRAWWMAVMRADPCSYCGRPAGTRVLEDGRRLPGGTLDHVDPRSGRPRGGIGLHDWANYVGACASCNHKKGDDPLLLFLIRRVGTPAPRMRPRRRHAPARRGPALVRGVLDAA